jgi:hypothetical protein
MATPSAQSQIGFGLDFLDGRESERGVIRTSGRKKREEKKRKRKYRKRGREGGLFRK